MIFSVEAAELVAKRIFPDEMEECAAELARAYLIAIQALNVCDLILKAAKPCVNGGDHMNECAAENALKLLTGYDKQITTGSQPAEKK